MGHVPPSSGDREDRIMNGPNDRKRLFGMIAERTGLIDPGSAAESDHLDAEVRQAVETLVGVGGTVGGTLSYASDAAQDEGAASLGVADARAAAGARFRVLRPHAR